MEKSDLANELNEALNLQGDLLAHLAKVNGAISVLVHVLTKDKGQGDIHELGK